MGTSSKASDAERHGALEDLQARLVLVEKDLSESQETKAKLARQAQLVERLTGENEKLKAARSELQFDLNACQDDLVAVKQQCLLLKYENGELRQSKDRLVGVQAELAETSEQLVSTQNSVVLLEHDNEGLRQRESELLVIRTEFETLREEHARLVEKQQQQAKRLADRESELARVGAKLLDAMQAVEHLKREQRRLSETNKIARARIKHFKAMYNLARVEIVELDALLDRLANGLQLMMDSRRWRLGQTLVSLSRRVVFRRNPPVVTDALVALVQKYRDGRRSSNRNWQRLAEVVETETSTSNEKQV